MTSKKYLTQLMKLDEQIKQKQSQTEELKAIRGNIGSFDYSEERVQTSNNTSSQVEKEAVKLVLLENEVKEDIIRYAFLKDKIIKEIHQLPNPNHITLLYKKYVEFKRLEVIAVEMGYAYSHVRKMHGCALQSFSKLIQNDTLECDKMVM